MEKTVFNYVASSELSIREYLLSFHLGKPKVYNLFQEKSILVNGELVKENYIIHKGDIISLIVEEDIDFEISNEPIDIVYEDEYFLILNKPSGIIIHSDEKKNEDSLCNRVAGYYKGKGIHLNVRYAHRLDKETTGIIVFCKDPLTHSYMNYFISTHEIRREYRALVQGNPKNKMGKISLPIGNDRHISGKMVISKSGKEAITNYETLYSYKGYSLVRILLETGRTHQIRLHMSVNGNPLLGDTLYGGQKHYISRVALHSYEIVFKHPVSNTLMKISAPIPRDMSILMKG